MRSPSKYLLTASVALAISAALWAFMPPTTRKQLLAADLPPGALLTIESPNFAALLQSWNASPEQSAWLTSASYSAFANSRLFSRLGDAQTEFEGVAGGKQGLDGEFLKQVAGQESIFAWYDISKLEFLYISHLPPGRSANVELLQQRRNFSRRQSGGTIFYVKTSTATTDDTATADADTTAPSAPRTISFAVRGDWLILATREDLIANALQLMQQQEAGAASQSEAAEGWYAAAEAAGPAHHGDLHMLLDLQRITATPSFRTYWVQRNITGTRHYRAAVVDLYREPHTFREERVLLPNTVPTSTPPQPDLAAVEYLVPERAGIYRATAAPQPADALAILNDKLLVRSSTPAANATSAPVASLNTPQPGDSTDLETRIDTASPALPPPSAANAPLLNALQAANLTALLTIDRTEPPASGVFIPTRSAVVLLSATPWNSTDLQAALLTALSSRITVNTLGLTWSPASTGQYLTLGSVAPLMLFTDGNTAIIANDASLLNDILARRKSSSATPQPATLIAGFRHTQERASFNGLSASLAHSTMKTTSAINDPAAPDFFADTIGSLSTAFRALATERFVERSDGTMTHQTVVYTWAAP